MKINLQNESTMKTKQAKIGYSWTFFFWAWFVPLIRGDWKWFLITFIVTLILAYTTMGVGEVIAQIAFAVIYNKLYVKDLLENGYTPADEFTAKALKGAGL